LGWINGSTGYESTNYAQAGSRRLVCTRE
jgi:hypothetical protein